METKKSVHNSRRVLYSFDSQSSDSDYGISKKKTPIITGGLFILNWQLSLSILLTTEQCSLQGSAKANGREP
jgi:hypothetical protein